MSTEAQAKRGRRAGSPRPCKVQPIASPEDVLPEGLPCDIETERSVLGLVLTDGARFAELAALTVDDFSLERHRRILRAMSSLSAAGENIDYLTVLDRLKQRGEHSADDLQFLLDLPI